MKTLRELKPMTLKQKLQAARKDIKILKALEAFVAGYNCSQTKETEDEAFRSCIAEIKAILREKPCTVTRGWNACRRAMKGARNHDEG